MRKKKNEELEEICNKMQEDAEGKIKERMGSQQSEFREIKVALDKVVKTFDIDAGVSIVE